MTRIDSDDVRINWHRSGGDDQVLVAVGAGDVKVAVAFPVDVDRRQFEVALRQRDRELDHYFAALDRLRDDADRIRASEGD